MLAKDSHWKDVGTRFTLEDQCAKCGFSKPVSLAFGYPFCSRVRTGHH